MSVQGQLDVHTHALILSGPSVAPVEPDILLQPMENPVTVTSYMIYLHVLLQ
jgi:hypothetical protein